jgi:hypothetical protein
MLITPRTYQLAQNTNQCDVARDQQYPARFRSLTGWQTDIADAQKAHKMLLVHQSGYVRVGEVIRYFSVSLYPFYYSQRTFEVTFVVIIDIP